MSTCIFNRLQKRRRYTTRLYIFFVCILYTYVKNSTMLQYSYQRPFRLTGAYHSSTKQWLNHFYLYSTIVNIQNQTWHTFHITSKTRYIQSSMSFDIPLWSASWFTDKNWLVTFQRDCTRHSDIFPVRLYFLNSYVELRNYFICLSTHYITRICHQCV